MRNVLAQGSRDWMQAPPERKLHFPDSLPPEMLLLLGPCVRKRGKQIFLLPSPSGQEGQMEEFFSGLGYGVNQRGLLG